MSKYRRRRVNLKAHDQGRNRHARGVEWARKRERLGQEIARMKSGRMRGASWQVRTSDGSESAVTSRDAGFAARDGAESNSARRPNYAKMAGLVR